MKMETTKELKSFFNPSFGNIRTATIEGEPWFVGRDVATALGYNNAPDALIKHVDEEDKKILKSQNATFEIGNRGMTIINESGLYSLVLSSKLPGARVFKRWITSEVIPQIRRTGAYGGSVPHSFAEALRLAADQQELLESQRKAIEAARPKVAFADAIVGSSSSCLIGELAKILRQNGFNVGQNRFFAWLRVNHFLGSSGEYYNVPNQQYIDQGLFELKKTTHSEGERMVTTTTTKVTGKGQMYFINGFRQGRFTI